jgi:uncharacterized membrane protein
MAYRSPVNIEHQLRASAGDRMADRVAARFGSWSFLGYMTALIVIWIAVNGAAWWLQWDPYPFILLNLVFSTQASYAAPIILLAQNRSAARDRLQTEHDFVVNQRAEAKIDLLLKHLDVPQDAIDAINAEMEAAAGAPPLTA